MERGNEKSKNKLILDTKKGYGMENQKTYIHILLNTLTKKNNILTELEKLTLSQKECLSAEPMDFNLFDEIMEQKEEFIYQLNQLDEGFEIVYTRVKEELGSNREKYKQEILSLQQFITQITEKSVQLQSLEVQNKLKLEIVLHNKKTEVRTYKANNQSVSSYYKNLANQSVGESFFVDKKK